MTSQPQDVRQQILHEATRLFVDRGYHGLSMREIAEAVGVSKAGLYYHFKDKEDLFLAILTNNLERLEQTIQQARQAAAVRGQVELFVTEIFQWAPEQRAIIRLASQEMDHLSQHSVTEFTRLYHAKFISQIQAMLAAGIEHGELRAMDPVVATWLLLGMMYPYLYSSHAGEMNTSTEAVQLMLSIFFDGAAT